MGQRLRLDNPTGYTTVRYATAPGLVIDQTFVVGLEAQHAATPESWQVPAFNFCDVIGLGGGGYQVQMGPDYVALFKASSWIDGTADAGAILTPGNQRTVRVRCDAGGNILVDVDGVNIITYTDPSPIAANAHAGFSMLESTGYFDTLTGTINEDFEAVTAQVYASEDPIGPYLIANSGGGYEVISDGATNPAEVVAIGRRLLIDKPNSIGRVLSATTHSAPIDETFRMCVHEQYQEQVEGWHVGHFFFSSNDALDGALGYMLQMGPQWISLFRNNNWVAGTEDTAHRFHLGVEKKARVTFTSGVFTLWIDDAQAFTWTDPSPINSGYIGLTGLNCRVHFDSLSGKITESFDSLAIQSYVVDQAIGTHLVSKSSTGISVEEIVVSGGGGGEDPAPGTVDEPPAPEIFANSPYLPSFAQQILNPCCRIQAADGTSLKTIRSASANGDQIDNLIITSTSIYDKTVELVIAEGGVDRVLGQLLVPYESGTDQYALRGSVDAMFYLNLPGLDGPNGLRPILLRPGSELKARVTAALESGAAIHIVGFGGAY